MPLSRFDRSLPWSGVLAGVLFAVSAAAGWGAPTAESRTYATWVGDHTGQIVVRGLASALCCVALLLFVTALRATLRSGEPGESTASSAAFAGGIVVTVALALSAWVDLATAEAAGKDADGAVATLGYLTDFSWLPFVAGAAVLYLATGSGGLRTATLPKPLAIASVVLGVMSVLGPAGIVVFLVTPVWLVVSGVVLGRRQTADAALPSSHREPAQV